MILKRIINKLPSIIELDNKKCLLTIVKDTCSKTNTTIYLVGYREAKTHFISYYHGINKSLKKACKTCLKKVSYYE
jgi:hypothetical protein